MIVAEIFYGIKCNRCGELNDDGEHSFWNDESSAIDTAMESEWISFNGKHYCPNCYHTNDEDPVPYPDFSVMVKDLMKFIKNSIVGYSLEIKESETEITLTKCLYNRQKLEDFEIAYISGLAGDSLISISCQKHERYTRHEVEIKLKKY